jgi:hypothetical protein
MSPDRSIGRVLGASFPNEGVLSGGELGLLAGDPLEATKDLVAIGGTQFLLLVDAVEAAIRDGDSLAMEGFTHLILHAAGHEVPIF